MFLEGDQTYYKEQRTSVSLDCAQHFCHQSGATANWPQVGGLYKYPKNWILLDMGAFSPYNEEK